MYLLIWETTYFSRLCFSSQSFFICNCASIAPSLVHLLVPEDDCCLWICSSCMNSCWCRVTSTAWRALRYGDFWCVFSEVWVLFQTHVLKYESWQVNEQHVLHHQPFHALCPIAACVFFLSLTSQHITCRPSWHGEWLVPRMDWAKFLWLLRRSLQCCFKAVWAVYLWLCHW